MIVILDELTPHEFFNQGGIVKIEVREDLVKEYDVKKKITVFKYLEYVRFFNTLYLKYLHKYPDSNKKDIYEKINSGVTLTPSIGSSKYTLDLNYDGVYSYTNAKFYYAGEKAETLETSSKDPYGIKNVCFSLMKPEDERWDECVAQRLERGFDYSELWNLDYTIARFILPRLKAFKESTGGYPYGMTNDEWHNILDRMIEGFELIVKDDIEVNEEEEKKKVEALDLLRDNFFSLWY